MGKKMYEQSDNTSVRKPITLQFFTRKAPSQEEQLEMAKQGYNWDGKNWRYVGTISNAGGKPSTDNRTAAERNRDYWSLSGASDRWGASWDNGTNPVKGALDSGLGYVNPVTAAANTAYDMYNAYDLLSSPQGLASTWGLLRRGQWTRAARSAMGDVMNVLDLVPGTPNTSTVRRTAQNASRTRRNVNIPEEVLANISDARQVSPLSRLISQALSLPTPRNAFLESLDFHILAANPSDKAILNEIRNGDWSNIRLLDLDRYKGIFEQHPDFKYTNLGDSYGRLLLLLYILNLRNQLQNGNVDRNVLASALGNNIYDDNPLYQEIKGQLPEGIKLLPARSRDMFNGTWNPENNAFMALLVEHGDDYLIDDFFHPFNDIRDIFEANSNLPVEYRHVNTYRYDGSYPFEYYSGDLAPSGATPELLLSKGLLGNTIGLFTDKQLGSISQDVFDNFLKRSWNQNVEGGHGVEFWSKPRNAETALEFLLTRGSAEAREEMRELLLDMQRSLKSGYVNFPHSLSIDSWPIWESQSLKLRNKTVLVPTELLKNSSHKGHGFFMPEDTPYAMTNALGLGNRMEASPELLKYIQDNKGLTMGDFNILDLGNGMSDIFHNGTRVGTLKMLSSDEALNKFNAQRRLIYRKNPELYPGDAVVSGSPYQYYVPFSPRLIKKEGGKLNVRLVKRSLK